MESPEPVRVSFGSADVIVVVQRHAPTLVVLTLDTEEGIATTYLPPELAEVLAGALSAAAGEAIANQRQIMEQLEA